MTRVYGIGKAIEAEPSRLMRKTPKNWYLTAKF